MSRSPSANAPKTAIMIAAALVITPPVRAMPKARAAASGSPAFRASATRATRKTS